jgi:capsular exopolysaccharide synthesis family protein
MSRIFDALHLSQIEQSGADAAQLLASPELLEVAERQAVKRQTMHGRANGEHQTEDTGADQFNHFQSAGMQVSPQRELVCTTDEESLVAEKFRYLGVRLRHLQQKRSLKRLLITSSMAEEGKTMVAANLACTLARKQQQKILLLEGDLRRPTLAKQFGLGKIPGLGELLQGKPTSTPMNIYQLETLGFWILTAGSPPQSPLELIQSRKLSLLMDNLSAWFDWIVIDSPPLLPLGDTTVWMRLADGILLVTRPGKTAKRQLQRGLEALEQSKLLGALLNGSTEASFDDYYRYCSPANVPHVVDQPSK